MTALSELLTARHRDTPAARFRRKAAEQRIRADPEPSPEAREAAALLMRIDPELMFEVVKETQELLRAHGAPVQIEMASLIESPGTPEDG